ncbi:MAG TPA: vanadium-dependent haloperoxidase [Thermoanaerobaculia bacterium]|nr:vanadium-dependent haloperoxidase [Thermoanaerobaculia bacterium]
MSRKLFVLLLCAGLLGAGAARADVVSDWNDALLDAVRVDKTSPPRASRAMAIVHVAAYDALIGVIGGYTPYHVADHAPEGASPLAAVAAAAHRALVALFPAQQATFDAALAASLAEIPDGAEETAGVAWGRAVADQILELRAEDNADTVVAYNGIDGANWWSPTGPGFAAALLPQWPLVTPWTMTSGAQFRHGPPPSVNSAEYAVAFHEVKRLGRVNSRARTAEQTEIALFWADGPGTATPPGHWLEIAQQLAEDRNLSLVEKQRLLALVSLAVADAAIVSWDHKYAYNHWRPTTGIQNADKDGNPATAPDPSWTPLIVVPPFPSYTSGHSTFSGAAARVLALFFGTDSFNFDASSDALPGVERSFTSLSAAADEAGQSRIYGGIHWQYDNQVGLASGRELADHVFFTQLAPLGPIAPCVAGPGFLCLQEGRFRVSATWTTGSGSGPAFAVSDTDDSGRFWFFDEDNIELVVKVLNGCAINDRFWFFASGLTDVEVLITVADTATGHTRRYFHRGGKAFLPVQDTDAFACD